MGLLKVTSTSTEMTRTLGAQLAAVLQPNDVIVLVGDLGTGKTMLAQGVARGLGIVDAVVSPTFAIAQEYVGRLRLNHLDVYRLDRVQEAIDLGLDELFEDAVTLIEWGDGVRDLLPLDRLEITLELLPPDSGEDDTRVITLEPFGAWRGRDLRDVERSDEPEVDGQE